MAAHASQIDENSFFLQMPPEVFRRGFGYEWFIHKGAEPGIHETSLFAIVRRLTPPITERSAPRGCRSRRDSD